MDEKNERDEKPRDRDETNSRPQADGDSRSAENATDEGATQAPPTSKKSDKD